MIRRPIIAAFVLIAAISVNVANAQQPASFKNFTAFRSVAPDVDFFASNRQVIAPYEKPVSEAITKLKQLFGANLPKGAIFVCSTLAQKDSIYEPKVLKSGYSWTLTAVTPEVKAQEMLARIKSQMGGEVPAEIKDRIQKMQSDVTSNAQQQMITTVVQQIAYAVLQTLLDKDIQFRSSRLDDMSKSPLPDWLDIGIACYVSGTNSALSYLKQNMDQTFPIEDVLSMARPFVATSSGQGGGSGGNRGGGGGASGGFPGGGGFGGGLQGGSPTGGGFPGGGQGGFGGRNMGGFGGANGGGGQGSQRGGSPRQMSKDEQDRMLFDGEASTFFSYLIEKIGLDKVKELAKQAQDGKESREYLSRPDVLGSDFEKIEEDWAAWVKAQK
ncbi:MAG TPA: hypothetical protein VMG30_21940 [Acidobacteriota bacterium]|nr:hypothetical protein [Acidobacteriota bacterium]